MQSAFVCSTLIDIYLGANAVTAHAQTNWRAGFEKLLK